MGITQHLLTIIEAPGFGRFITGVIIFNAVLLGMVVPVSDVPSTFETPDTRIGVLDSVAGDATLGGVLARESASGADLEPVYRALYLGLSCELLQAA